MITYAAGTWGISGPGFLALFWATALAIAAATGARAWRAHPSAGTPPPVPLGPAQVAYLAGGGRRRAVTAALASLRHRGLIDAGAGGFAPATDATSANVGGLEDTVYRAVQHRVPMLSLLSDPAVANHTAQIREELEELGLRPDRRARLAAWTGAGLLLALAGLGVARVVAGLAAGRPVGFLVGSLVVVVVGAGGLLAFAHRPRTRRGAEAFRETRNQYQHLAPERAPAWRTYGPTAAAMGVAIFGADALWSMDLGLAKAMAAPVAGAAYTGGGGGGCGGGGCGGGCGCGG